MTSNRLAGVNAIKTALAGASLITQVVGLLSMGFMVFDLATLPETLMAQAADDTALINRYVLETVASYGAWVGAGLAAAFVAWLLIVKGKYKDVWFLRISRVLAWSWLPLIPVGTIAGVLVLSARAAAIADEESQP